MMDTKSVVEVFDIFFNRLEGKLSEVLIKDFPDLVIRKGSWEAGEIISSSLSIYLSHDYEMDSIDPMISARVTAGYIQLDMDITLSSGVIISNFLQDYQIDRESGDINLVILLKDLCNSYFDQFINGITKHIYKNGECNK